MSTSRSSSAGPSRTPSPLPTSSYRIERFDAPSTSSADLMVTSRAKRSTAGNRLKALLDQELEKDEVFAEVENDVDFEANENEDGVDIVDSDFDRDSDDNGANGEGDESEGEREIEAQERMEKSRRRAAARAVGTIKRPTGAAAVVQRATRRAAPAGGEAAAPEAKRRRISFAPDQPSSSSPGAPDRRRASARTATVQSKLEVQSRLEEASQRRAAQPVKHVVKKKASLTQDALIAEALEVEEENRESLRRFLEQEEERRAKQRQRKERITGPFVRWMSVGLKTKVVQEVKDGTEVSRGGSDASGTDGQGARKEEADRGGATGESEHKVALAEGGKQQGASDSCALAGGEASKDSGVERTDDEQVSTLPLPPAQPEASATPQGKAPATGTLDKDAGADDATMADSAAATAQNAAASSAALKQTESDTTPVTTSTLPTQQPRADTTTVDRVGSTSTTTAPTTNASLTLDPVIAARQQAALLRSSTSTTPSPSSTYEQQARTLLSVERTPADWEWVDTHNALLGTHCSWDAFPFVPSRNRPLKPRQSICPITGLPAIYRDPRTGIAYANAYAYKVITKVLAGRFVWSGGHYEERDAGSGRKGKARVGKGAVPIEMGVWLDDEEEKGPGKVWDTAREVCPSIERPSTTTAERQPSQKHATPSKHKQATRSATPSAPSASKAPAATTPQTAEEKRKSKPGFDVVLTNAIAPGDEKAVLAAALSLPAGSTRSGRRVQRS